MTESDTIEELRQRVMKLERERCEYKVRCEKYREYLEKTHRLLDYEMWERAQRMMWLEYVEEPQRCESPVPPREYDQ